jgi:hypothetical protein
MLKQKGRFIQISRNMLEGEFMFILHFVLYPFAAVHMWWISCVSFISLSMMLATGLIFAVPPVSCSVLLSCSNLLAESRQKYAARSLKQNVEYVEAETRRLFNKVAQIRDHLKRQHLTIRYLLPMDFHETFDRLVDFLENLETKGGVEEIMALPPANTILAYDQQGNLPKAMLDAIIAKIKPMIAQEVAGVKTQMQSLKEDGLTLAQFAEIMQPESEGEGANTKNSALSKEKVLGRRRTMDLIKGCISQERKAVEEAQAKQREIEEAERAGKLTVSNLMNGLSTSPRQDSPQQRRPKTPSMILIQERSDTANRTYVDEKVRELEEQLSHLRLTVDASKDTSANDLAFLSAKLDALEVASENMQRHDAEAREQRKKDSEALKVMQKRLATVSVDNVSTPLSICISLVCWETTRTLTV